MFHIPVSSSNLSSVAYADGTLEIRFQNGSTYQYFNVPEAVYRGLLGAASKGRYHALYIKNRYPYRRIW